MKNCVSEGTTEVLFSKLFHLLMVADFLASGTVVCLIFQLQVGNEADKQVCKSFSVRKCEWGDLPSCSFTQES